MYSVRIDIGGGYYSHTGVFGTMAEAEAKQEAMRKTGYYTGYSLTAVQISGKRAAKIRQAEAEAAARNRGATCSS